MHQLIDEIKRALMACQTDFERANAKAFIRMELKEMVEQGKRTQKQVNRIYEACNL